MAVVRNAAKTGTGKISCVAFQLKTDNIKLTIYCPTTVDRNVTHFIQI